MTRALALGLIGIALGWWAGRRAWQRHIARLVDGTSASALRHQSRLRQAIRTIGMV